MSLRLAEVARVVGRLAREQGELALRRWSAAGPRVAKGHRDFATGVDLEIERNLKAELAARFPDHGLSGEETGDEATGAEYQWLIDPIDGTKYYAAGASLFAVSVGLFHRGEPVLGVVYAAASRQCFHAWRGGGAFLDERRLTGSAATDLSAVIANVDTPEASALSAAGRRWFEDRLLALTRGVYRARALGQGSLAACWLASGAFDAYVDLTGYSRPQDLAAGRVIMAEAAMRVEHLDPGVGPPRLVAAPPRVFEDLRRLLIG